MVQFAPLKLSIVTNRFLFSFVNLPFPPKFCNGFSSFV